MLNSSLQQKTPHRLLSDHNYPHLDQEKVCAQVISLDRKSDDNKNIKFVQYNTLHDSDGESDNSNDSIGSPQNLHKKNITASIMNHPSRKSIEFAKEGNVNNNLSKVPKLDELTLRKPCNHIDSVITRTPNALGDLHSDQAPRQQHSKNETLNHRNNTQKTNSPPMHPKVQPTFDSRNPIENKLGAIGDADKASEASKFHAGTTSFRNMNTNLPSQLHRINIQQPIQNQVLQNQAIEILASQGIDGETLSVAEARLLLNRAFDFSLGVHLLALTLIFMINKFVSYQAIFIVLYVCLAYFISRLYIRNKRQQRDAWKRKEDLFYSLDAICATIFCVCFNLKVNDIIPNMWMSCIPFMMTTLAYMLTSDAPNIEKLNCGILRFVYAIEALLISIQLDETLAFDWQYILISFWFIFGVFAIQFAGYFIVAFSLSLVYLYKMYTRQPFEQKKTIIGLLWYSSYYALSICGLVGI